MEQTTHKNQFSEWKQVFPADRSAHLKPKAENVMVLRSTGDPSHMDVFDPKP